jgi:hypothetical protein
MGARSSGIAMKDRGSVRPRLAQHISIQRRVQTKNSKLIKYTFTILMF